MTASELMASFADRTGLTGAKPQRRYLWTDAFAICTGAIPRTGRSRAYREHEDINDVMLATSLEPNGFLVLHA